MSMFRTIVLFLGTLAFPGWALAAAPKTFSELAEMIVSIIDTGTGVLIVLGFVVYFWGISTNVLKFEDDPDKRKAYFFWGLLVLFVMVSIWGIVGLLQNTLFGGGTFNTGGGEEIPLDNFETPWTDQYFEPDV